MIEEEPSEDYMLYIVESDRLRSLCIKEFSQSEEEEEELKNQNQNQKIKHDESQSTLISTLINSSSSSSSLSSIQIQVKDAKISINPSILSILINDHQILQIQLPNHLHLQQQSSNHHQNLKLINLPNHQLINLISSSSDSLIFSSSNSTCFLIQSTNSNQPIQLKHNLNHHHHHHPIQHLTISLDSNLIISSSTQHGVMVFDQSNQSNHQLNIKSKSKITSISVSSFSFKLFTINLQSKILLFDLGLHSTKPITAFKLNHSTQHQHQHQSILINAHFSTLNSNLIIFLNQLGQVGLGDLTHHKLISQTQLQLSTNAFIKLSEFSPNGKTLICLTTDGKLISKDLKSSKQITLLKLSSIETSSALRLLFQSNLSSDPNHTNTHVNQLIPKSRSRSKTNTKTKTKPSRDPPTETETLHNHLSNPTEISNHHSSSSSSSSISTLISPKLKPISSQPKSKKEFELGVKSEARVSTLVSKLDEPSLGDEPHGDRRMRCVDLEVLERIVEGCVNRSMETHQRMMMEKFEELKLDVLRQGFSTRKELNEVFDQFVSHHFLNGPSTFASSSNTH